MPMGIPYFHESEFILGTARGHALAFSVKSAPPRSPVGSGCAPASISVPQPLLVHKNIMEFNDFSYTKVIKCYLPPSLCIFLSCLSDLAVDTDLFLLST